VPLNLIVTPTRTIETESTGRRPDGLYWEDIDAETIAEIPVLGRLYS